MKTSKKIKIGWAVICAIVAVSLCIAVINEWKAQGCTMEFSLVAGCIVYIAGSVALWIAGKEFVDFIDYWWFNGDEYYKKGRK